MCNAHIPTQIIIRVGMRSAIRRDSKSEPHNSSQHNQVTAIKCPHTSDTSQRDGSSYYYRQLGLISRYHWQRHCSRQKRYTSPDTYLRNYKVANPCYDELCALCTHDRRICHYILRTYYGRRVARSVLYFLSRKCRTLRELGDWLQAVVYAQNFNG